jgi:potassium efflux system protein
VSVLALGATTLWLGTALVLNHAGLVQLREVLGLILGIGGIVLGVWLWVRRDVLLSLVPRDTGSLLARTSRSLLRFGWPLGVLLWAANIVLNALGYRTASSFFAQRALLLLAALLLLGLLHAMARAWLLRHAPQEAESGFDDSSDRATSRHAIGNRLLWQLLGIGSLVGVIGVTSAVFEIGSDDWRALGAWSLTGGAAGTGITLGRLFKGIVILVVTAMIARHARDLMRVFLRSRSRIEQGTRYAVRTLLFYVIIVVGSVAALAALGLDMTQFGWFLTAAGVGIGFGLQEIFSNLISGLILFFERPVQVGDVVTVGDVQGDVQQINLRSTVIRTGDGVSIILPNKRLITDDVINWSHGQKRTRLQIEVGVAYGSDTELVRRVLLQCASSNERVMRRPVPDVEFRSFGDSQLTFILYCWLPSPDITLRRRARSEMNTAIDTAFAANGITIPFPQRDVHVKREPRTEA